MELVKPASKADTTNPKDLFGNKKVSFSKIPTPALVALALAMMEGAEKYGAYNWRDKAVIASIYLDAIDRHKALWQDGERTAADSLTHHLGHVMACCAILIDAEANGCLIDDRPVAKVHGLVQDLFTEAERIIETRRNKRAA